MCMCSAVIDVQMIAKLVRGIFACVAGDVMIEDEPAANFFFHARGSRARPPPVRTSDLEQVNVRPSSCNPRAL